jgi:ubiquinone/menaquinone biosynthesis C-methylase UbiE
MRNAMKKWDDAYSSGSYRREWDYAQPSQELVSLVATADLPRGSVALDVGCGAGREAIFLAKCGFLVIGVDFSAAAIRIAQRRGIAEGVTVDWHVADVSDLPVHARSVDFVNDRGCFHVVERRQRRRFANEIARVLRPGGRMLLRGAATSSKGGGFVAVTAEEINQWFDRRRFSRGPVLPIVMIADSGTLRGNLVVLQRR